ncbi:serine/threonine-protein kinase Nek10-like [Physella acuta]|uniref:serine/threonine-protein kinase Nek10-like n=1 Tax=Physella acuta TaxID=109671 RepID=UPI0027DD10CD|nr:serine/threonine-protein kinase Nek10-like [Physella acuta]XP_059145412.1 serine/threonine-protein kinase Nek10-like [Physella acuta]
MPTGDKQNKSPESNKESKQLHKLIALIKTPASTQQLPSLKYSVQKNSPVHSNISQSGSVQSQRAEAVQLENFSLKYKEERLFSVHPLHNYFAEIHLTLTKNRLCSQEWLNYASAEHVLRVLICLRILLRDPSYQKEFFKTDGLKSLAQYFHKVTEEYFNSTDGPYSVDILKEITNIFQKLSASVDRFEKLVVYEAHKPLVRLLEATDVIVLHCSLYALIGLAQSKSPRLQITELSAVHILLRIIEEYDTISKKLAANLLRLLCADSQAREQVKIEDGVPLLLSQLHSENVSLLWHIVWCLVLLCEDADCRDDIRQLGGIPLILALLHDRKFVSERTDTSKHAVLSAGLSRKTVSNEEHEEFFEHQFSLKKACCAALTELVLNDTNAQQIVQANGIYSLGLLILPQKWTSEKEKKRATKLQQNAFRALRFLFSMERNRRLFKQLFPPDLFEMFIDVGHYNRDLSAYMPLADKINSLPKEDVNEIAENISNTNQNKEPNYYIGDYAVFELLGSGAFGSVYKVRKKAGRQSFFALKEVNLQNMVFGKSAKEKEMSVGEITNELKIMKEEMRHPNVVRYYRTFELNDKLYIVMEYIEGAHLGEHFNSLKEKNDKFQQARIWNILLQLILALRYLHKEKGIVHRDLTPSNIMLGENDKVTITDFGLAKQKRSECSKMTSVVGTILYSCPEVVQNMAYGEKADIWALGCILYQMCALEPPFNSTNMLTLVNKIVAADYKPIPEKEYSPRLLQTIKSCLCVNPEDRPDILQLSGQLADILLTHMDQLRISQTALERKLERERKRTQKHFLEANRNMQNYHRLFLASQEGYDKLTNLAGSDGAEGFKTDTKDSYADCSDAGIGSSVAVSISSIHFGDISDEDSYPSSSSESRESSAGSVRSQRHCMPKLNRPQLNRRRQVMPDNLELDIPAIAKTSRDSGLSSGDPSPNATPILHYTDMQLNGRRLNISRSISTNEVAAASIAHRLDKRSRSAAMLTISPNRLREINDPVQQMLHQLHKLIYITQLPPTLSPNPNRRIIEQYKRALFSTNSTSLNLKSEIQKLIQGSKDIIDLNFGNPEYLKRSSVAGELDSPLDPDKPVMSFYDPDYKEVGITYEYMQTVLEAALKEAGYYKVDSLPRYWTP